MSESFLACANTGTREKLRILSELLQENNTPSSQHEIQQTCNDHQDPMLESEEVATSSVACQTPAPVKVGT